MRDYLGKSKGPMEGEVVYVESLKGYDDWRGILLHIGANYIVVDEHDRRKFIPFTSFLNMVFVKDLEGSEKNTKPYKL